MAAASYVQTSFLGGFWSKVAQGRFDHPEYKFAMNECLNGLPGDTGAWFRRSGFDFTQTTRNGQPAKLISYPFQQTSPYSLEFTNGFMRAVIGPQLAMTNDAQTVTNISTANPAKVTTVGNHGWATGNQVQIAFPNDRCAILQNRQLLITVTGFNEFTLSDPLTGATIDGTSLNWAATPTVTVSRIFELVTVYTPSTLSTIRLVQAENSGLLLQGTFKPQTLQATPPTDTAAFASFAVMPTSFIDGPYLDPVTGGTLATPGGLTGNVDITLSFNTYDATRSYAIGDYATSGGVNYKSIVDANLNHAPPNALYWAPVASTDAIGPLGFQGTDVGRLVRLFSEPPLWTLTTIYAAGNVVAYGGTYYKALAGTTASATNTPNTTPASWAVFPTGAIWTWGKITALISGIDRTTGTTIGSLVNNGGIAASFDGITDQAKAASSCIFGNIGDTSSSGHVGKNYTGVGGETIGSATVFPSNNSGFIDASSGTGSFTTRVTLNLRAKMSAPASHSDGVLLGTTGSIPNQFTAVNITSNDQTTVWNYVWVEILVVAALNSGATMNNLGAIIAEVKLFNAAGAGTTNGITVQILGDNLLYTSAIRVWRLGLYSDTTGWPTCGTFHEGRIWLSGVVKNRIDGGVSNGFNNGVLQFAPTGTTGAVADNNAISYVFNAEDSNPIAWMKSDDRGIICGTQAGEWLVTATANNNILTPTSIQAHRVTRIGCANVEPCNSGLTYAFVQRYKRKIQEYFADVFSGKFASPNLAERAKSLTKSGVEQITYQNELAPVLWSRLANGNLIGVTYKRDSLLSSQGPKFTGWHRHQIASGYPVESMCSGPSADGTTDTLTISTYDPATGVRHLAYLNKLFEEDDDLVTDARFLDDAVSPTSYTVVTNGITFNGLWHLNGKSVTVMAGGLDCGEHLVTNGSCTVPWQSDPDHMFTAEYYLGNGVLHTVIGLGYTSRGQILRPQAAEDTGARAGPAFGKVRRTDQFGALIVSSRGLSFGTEFDDLNPANEVDDGGTALDPTALYSALHWDTLADDYSFDSMLCWEITRPFPAIVAAIGGFPNTQDR